MLDIFENFRVLAYADDLKLYIVSAGLGLGLQGWCHGKKYDLNAGKCNSISFSRGSNLVMFQYIIDDSDLERFDVINDLGVPVDSRMTFVGRIESIVSKSARMLGFIKRIKRCMWLLSASCVWSRIERIQHNFIRFALRGLCWTTQPLPLYESRCLLLGLEVLSDRNK
jgi:hypothetical protein